VLFWNSPRQGNEAVSKIKMQVRSTNYKFASAPDYPVSAIPHFDSSVAGTHFQVSKLASPAVQLC
jgi:hypothetical protein